MTQKEKYLEALKYLPDGVSDALNTPIPTIDATWMPDNVDDAVIVQGILANNINTILNAFEGLTPVELLLRIGQYNPVPRDMLLSGLEFIGSISLHEFSIIYPEGGIGHEPGEVFFQAEVTSGIEDLIAIQVSIDGSTHTLTLSEGTENQFENTITLAQGTYTATFSGRFDAGDSNEFVTTHDVLLNVGV